MREAPHSPGAVDSSATHNRLAVLRRRWWIVLACVVLVPAAAFAFSETATKRWTATAKLLFRDPGFDQKLFGASYLAPSTDPAREAATNVKLVSLEVVSDRAARQLGGGLRGADVERRVSIASQGQSDVVAVSATDHDPRFAARLANAVAGEYIVFRRQADRAKISAALTLVQQQLQALAPEDRTGPQGRALRSRAGQLQTLSSLQTGNAELVQPAEVPTEPSFPSPVRNAVLGLVIGAILGLLLAGFAERIDRRLRDHGEIEAILGRPILAEVPESAALHVPRLGQQRFGGREVESFRTLRTALRFLNVGRRIDSVVVTSAVPGEGKSTIALNLALAAAASGSRVVLVEADLRRPRLMQLLGLPRQAGLVGMLVGEETLDDLAEPYVIAPGMPSGELAVIAAGGIPPNPSELLASPAMMGLLDELRGRYDQVIVDTPPLTLVSDAVPLMQHASGTVVVVRSGQSTRPALRELRRRMDHLGVQPLGVVLNSARTKGGYDYAYYEPQVTASVETNGSHGAAPTVDHAS